MNAGRSRITWLFWVGAPAAILLGVALGVGGFTFVYARGSSYLTNDPAACANCHVMNDQYNAWRKSSHHAVAVCNDCHAPHSFVDKYFTKALNGFNHSVAFTSGDFPEPIDITDRNRRVTEQQCRHCHQDVVAFIDTSEVHKDNEQMSCIRCHASVGHMTRR